MGELTGPDRPSRHGAILGDVLAKMVEQAGGAPEMCLTCAFRRGTTPNTSAGTALTAYKCVIDVDPDDFGCHHGLASDGRPTRMCAGYEAARRLGFTAVKALSLGLDAALKADPAEDQVRAKYDAWLSRVDPHQKLNVYQIARAWASDHPTPETTHADR